MTPIAAPPTVQLRAAALRWTPPPQAGEENGAEVFSLGYPLAGEENGAQHVSFLPRLRGRCRGTRPWGILFDSI